MAKPRSFIMFLRRRYRVYFNAQTGYWFADYREGSGRKRVSLGVRTKPEAEDGVRKFDTPPTEVRHEQARVTWQEFQGKYLDYKRSQGKAPGTLTRYKAALDACGRFLRTQGIEYMDQIALTDIERYIPYRTGKPELCDPKTAYNDALVIKNAFKWGARPARRLLASNPAECWETPEPVKPKRRCYTLDEVAKMESGVRPWLRPIVTMLAWSGLRIGELVNLRWKDVDLDSQIVHVRIRDDWKPKGKADRIVPMHPRVRAVIQSQPVGLYVFRGPRNGRIKETYALECRRRTRRRWAWRRATFTVCEGSLLRPCCAPE